ncbi:P-loop containing nucleoside triphosphate hydrolase protein [Collybia nuda]|uniref:P-loop containing nucleoside triphosphate hydrolase protein n=1 Tax=Collybia nuda TaxID=64659 RepID=A0A9P6CNZ2_9AGAR|nr:P-loop containing nucleoside triphosphate hydrolase protein [Collybia nuda]
MPTIKLVVIGASGVGKTSLRGQYISGRFSNGYRATIGADFITKILPHPSRPDESITLQIWDTAGQERFSSLSTAFFRGADAALLMFDVNSPQTMEALIKWWAEFKERAPLNDQDMEDFCCVVVGNKTDMIDSPNKTGESPINEAEALDFLHELVPLSSPSPSPIHILPPDARNILPFPSSSPISAIRQRSSPPSPQMRSNSIAIASNPNHVISTSPSYSPKHHLSRSRSRTPSYIYGGTMTTTHTSLTIYHTPSSSLSDIYQSARSSPEPWSGPSSSVSSPSTSPGIRVRRTTARSTGSTSSGSAATITPSLFAREAALETTTPTLEDPPYSILPPPPARGPKLFFTSAKTGEGVANVFEYIAARVVRRWEYEEHLEARQMHIREASAADTIMLGTNGRKQRIQTWSGCCGS